MDAITAVLVVIRVVIIVTVLIAMLVNRQPSCGDRQQATAAFIVEASTQIGPAQIGFTVRCPTVHHECHHTGAIQLRRHLGHLQGFMNRVACLGMGQREAEQGCSRLTRPGAPQRNSGRREALQLCPGVWCYRQHLHASSADTEPASGEPLGQFALDNKACRDALCGIRRPSAPVTCIACNHASNSGARDSPSVSRK